MRRTAFSFILLIILTTCCTNRRSRYDAVLVEIDSLTEVDADSARVRLAALGKEMGSASEKTKAYYDLLRVKADDKAMVKHTSDSLICKVAQYFERHTDDGHLPEAYYYVGRANSDLQNGEKALIYFQKALLEDSIHVTSHLKSRIYAQMGYIYLRNGLFDDAIAMQQLAHFYCQQIGDTLGMRYSSEDINTIMTLAEKVEISEMPKKEVMMTVQKLNAQVRNQLLHHQNERLQTENDKRTSITWIVTLVALAVMAVAAWVVLRLHQQIKERKEKTAGTPQPRQRQFYDKEISELLTTHLYNNKVLKPADWQVIETRLLEAFPTFKDSLYSFYNLSETEYHICLLIKAEVSPSNMAKLLATGNSTISQSRLRMQQKVFNGQGTAKDWDNFVLSL
ncbi:MAG: hypothetical protein IJP82_01770 [Bacteroidaceae bacterium]|nr:hypothetical protein [Bacteroidaceae bacterium]